MKTAQSLRRIRGGLLDALFSLPYWRGKGRLVLSLLQMDETPFAARMPNRCRIWIGADAIRQTLLPYWIGQYESAVQSAFRYALTQLEPSASVMDVGANLGFYTILAAGYLGPNGNGTVYAFEPNPPIYAELCRNIELNQFHNVVAQPKAVAAEQGTLTLYSQDDGVTLASLRPSHSKIAQGIAVPVIALDKLNFTRPMGLLKIDVEGAELLVLQGAQQRIERDRPIILYEEFEEAYNRFGYSSKDVRDFFAARDYLLARIENEKGAAGYGNLLAVPRERQWTLSAS